MDLVQRKQVKCYIRSYELLMSQVIDFGVTNRILILQEMISVNNTNEAFGCNGRSRNLTI